MNKVITIIGGNGYVGSRCIGTLLKNTRNVKIISVSRSVETNNLNSFNDRVEHIKTNFDTLKTYFIDLETTHQEDHPEYQNVDLTGLVIE